jgi:SAM-dependent methyltransferase
MKTLQPTVAPYAVVERATRIYNVVLDIFDYNKTSDLTTPYELALAQVRELPTRTGKVLVPGAGIGTYILALLEEGFNPEQITAVDLDPAYSRLGHGIFNRFGVNYVTADFLNWQPEMKFDVIVGNPPYQDSANKLKAVKLWPKFITRSLDLLNPGGYLLLVTPSTWLKSRTGNGKRVRDSLTKGFNLKSVNTSAGSYFKVGVDICSWFGVKETYNGSTSVDNEPFDLREVYATQAERKLYEVFDKVLDVSIPKLPLVYTNRSLKKDELVDDGEFEVHFSGSKVKRTNVRLEGGGVPKFVAPWSCAYKAVFHTTLPTGIFNCWFECPEEEFESYKPIWSLKIVRLLCEQYKKTCGFTPAVEYGLIPDFRFMTDEETYVKLGLTTEQIELVESMVR